jgi:hypothetical protein
MVDSAGVTLRAVGIGERPVEIEGATQEKSRLS